MNSKTLSDGGPRLDFLHGVRGLAALAIVLFHLTLNTGPESAGPIIRTLNVPLLHGYLAVPVFLVLSGFLLSMPVVTNGLTLRGGISGFMWRRSLRILPAYYAAYLLDMLFFVGMSWLFSLLGRSPGTHVQEQMTNGFRWPSVVAHILLVHNTSVDWVSGMDAILWSIACEWQIYLLFAFALVPIWRRFGVWVTLAICTALAAALTEGYARGWCVYFLPWMIPIFGIGAAGASIAFGQTPQARVMRRWPWGTIALTTGLMMVTGIALLDASVPLDTLRGRIPVPYYVTSLRVQWIYDMLAAVAAAAFIVWLTQDCERGERIGGTASRIRRLLESRWLQGLGLFSYSLYLTHGIVLVFMARATQFLWPHHLLHWAAMMIVGTLLSLTLAYVFHLCFERRFMDTATRDMFSRRIESPSAAAARVAEAHSRSSGD